MRNTHHDVYVGMAFVVFSIFLLYMTTNLPARTAGYPFIVVIIMCVLSAVTLWRSVVASKRMDDKEKEDADYLTIRNINKPLVALTAVTAYALGIDFVGFFLSTACFLVGLMFYCGVRSWKVMVASVVGMNAFIYVVFVWQLEIAFPEGIAF